MSGLLFPAAVVTHLQAGHPTHLVDLVHLVGRDRSTGAAVSAGFSSEIGTRIYEIDGVDRSYVGGGTVVSLDAPIYEQGMDVQYFRVALNFASVPVREAFQIADMASSVVRVDQAVHDGATLALIGTVAIWRGDFPGIEFETGRRGVVTLDIPSRLRRMTMPSALKISDASMRLRAAGDDFRQFSGRTREVTIQTEWLA